MITAIGILFFIAVAALAIVYIYMAAFTSWHVAKSDYFEPGQKYAQYAIIWLLPIIGAALVLHILAPDMRRPSPGWIPWVDYLLVASFVCSVDAASLDAADVRDTSVDASVSDGGVDN